MDRFIEREENEIWRQNVNKRLEVLSVFSTGPFTYEKEDITINIDNSMTASEVQEKINAIGKYIEQGINIKLQSADGTYSFDDTLFFQGFRGAGNLLIDGNSSDFVAGTSKSVIWDFSSLSKTGVKLINNTANIYFRGIQVKVKTDAATVYGIYIYQNKGRVYLSYSNFYGNSTNYGIGIWNFESDHVRVESCYVSNIQYGFRNGKSSTAVTIDSLYDTGTQPKYGVYANYADIHLDVGPNASISATVENNAKIY